MPVCDIGFPYLERFSGVSGIGLMVTAPAVMPAPPADGEDMPPAAPPDDIPPEDMPPDDIPPPDDNPPEDMPGDDAPL